MPNTKLAIDTAYDQLQEMTFARSPFFENITGELTVRRFQNGMTSFT